MLEEFLPIGNVFSTDELSISETLNMPTLSTIGYFVELELEYPASTHNQYKDYPLAPVKEKVLDAWLNEFQIDKKERFNLPQAKFSKLMHTMYDNRHFVLHFKLLQLCVQLGMRITKMHRANI